MATNNTKHSTFDFKCLRQDTNYVLYRVKRNLTARLTQQHNSNAAAYDLLLIETNKLLNTVSCLDAKPTNMPKLEELFKQAEVLETQVATVDLTSRGLVVKHTVSLGLGNYPKPEDHVITRIVERAKKNGLLVCLGKPKPNKFNSTLTAKFEQLDLSHAACVISDLKYDPENNAFTALAKMVGSRPPSLLMKNTFAVRAIATNEREPKLLEIISWDLVQE